MAVQFGNALRDARVAAIETTAGTSAKLQIRTGAQPANCAAASTGTLLVEITLPSDWLTTDGAGVASKAGTWSAAAAAAGTAAHYRLFNNAVTVCHEQGSVTATGGGGDLTLDNTSIASAQTVTVTTWTRTDGNA